MGAEVWRDGNGRDWSLTGPPGHLGPLHLPVKEVVARSRRRNLAMLRGQIFTMTNGDRACPVSQSSAGGLWAWCLKFSTVIRGGKTHVGRGGPWALCFTLMPQIACAAAIRTCRTARGTHAIAAIGAALPTLVPCNQSARSPATMTSTRGSSKRWLPSSALRRKCAPTLSTARSVLVSHHLRLWSRWALGLGAYGEQ
jgi:hypothetical protein